MVVTLEKMIGALGVPMKLASARPGDLTIARWQHLDAEVNVDSHVDEVAVIVNLSNTQRVERRMQGIWQTLPSFAIGSFSVVDPELGAEFKVKGRADVLQLLLPASAVAALPGRPSVKSRFQATDIDVERCALRALVTLKDGDCSDRLLVSQLAHELALSVTADKSPRKDCLKGGLSSRSVRRLNDLIDSRVVSGSASSLTLSVLATEVNLSVFHFAREFRKTIGTTPYEYVLRQKLGLARSMIATSTMSLDDIAKAVGFRSRAHFGAAFRKKMGVTPAAFRRALHADRPTGSSGRCHE